MSDRWKGILSLSPPGTLDVAAEARLVLEVVPGERRLLPEFGCRVHGLRRIETSAERHLAAVFVEEALARWAPSLGEVRAEVHASLDGILHLALRLGTKWYDVPIRHRHATRPTARVEASDSGDEVPFETGEMEESP
jgi:phage baseplate assembly protein W